MFGSIGTRLCVVAAAFIATAPMLAFAYPNGAGTCDVTMMSDPHGTTPASGDGGFQLGAKPAGNGKFSISLAGNSQFEGLLLYVTDDGGNRLGTFSGVPSGLKLLSTCGDSGSQPVTHSSSDLKKAGFAVNWDAGKTSGKVTAKAIVLTALTTWYKLPDLSFDLSSTQSAGNTAVNANSGSLTTTDNRNAIVAFFEDYTLFAIVFGISTALYGIGAVLELVLKRQRMQQRSTVKKGVGL